jgi:hypothetical protein
MIEDIIKEDWFSAWREELRKSFTNRNLDLINEQYHFIIESVNEWRYSSGPLYSIIPLSNELNGQKLGKEFKSKPPSSKRYIQYGFEEGGAVVVETWDLSGDRDRFGFYANFKSKKVDTCDSRILFIQKNEKLNTTSLNAITEQKSKDKELNFYLTVNGTKPNNWLLRIDVLEDGIVKLLQRFDPVFNLKTEFRLNYNDNGQVVEILYNDKVHWLRDK